VLCLMMLPKMHLIARYFSFNHLKM
jgi:hypothetical protein